MPFGLSPIALVYLAAALIAGAASWRTGRRGFRALAGLAVLAWGFENFWTVRFGWDGAPPLIAASDLGIAMATTRVAQWSGLWTTCRLIVALYALRFAVQVAAALGPDAGRYGNVFYASLNLLYALTLVVLFGGALLELAANRGADRAGHFARRPARGVAVGAVARDAGTDQG